MLQISQSRRLSLTTKYRLPAEIVFKIVSYLSPQDFIRLFQSQLFFEILLYQHWSFLKLQSIFFHLLIMNDLEPHWTFKNNILFAFLYNNEIYFCLDTFLFDYLTHRFPSQPIQVFFNKLTCIKDFHLSLFLPTHANNNTLNLMTCAPPCLCCKFNLKIS